MKKKKIIKMTGILLMYSALLTFAYIFFLAYFNDYEISVTVNDFHEAHIELFLLIISLVTGTFVFIINLLEFAKNESPTTKNFK